MLARQIFFSFLFFYVTFTLKSYFFPFIFIFIWVLWEYLFSYNLFPKPKIRYFVILTTGIFFGAILALFRYYQYHPKETKNFLHVYGKILQVSRKSVIVLSENIKFRLILEKEALNLNKGDEISFSCEKGQGEIFLLEKLQKILFLCKSKQEIKIIKQKPKSYLSQLKQQLQKILLENLGQESLAQGIVFADTHDMDEFSLSLFRSMGIAHLFAASGLHLGMLFGFVYLPFRFLGLNKLGYFLGTLVSLGFLLLLEIPISLFRAFIFLLIFLIKKFSDQKLSQETIIFLTALITEIAIPYSSFTISFILSFGVTSGIFLFFSPVKKILANIRWKSFLKDHLALTLSTFAAANFLSILIFQKINPLSLFYNFLAVPPTALYLGSVLFGFLIPQIFSITKALDWFYRELAFWHFNLIQKNFFSTPYWAELIWSCMVLLLFLWLFWLNYKKRFLLAKKYFFKLFIAIFLSYGIFFYMAQKKSMSLVKAIPFFVLEYHNKKLKIFGEKAPFVELDSIRAGEFFLWPIKAIEIDPNLQVNLPKNLNSLVSFVEQEKPRFGLLISQQACYVFFSQMKPERWPRDALKNCEKLFLILGKKDQEKDILLKPIFSYFGYKKEEKILPYFQWMDLN